MPSSFNPLERGSDKICLLEKGFILEKWQNISMSYFHKSSSCEAEKRRRRRSTRYKSCPWWESVGRVVTPKTIMRKDWKGRWVEETKWCLSGFPQLPCHVIIGLSGSFSSLMSGLINCPSPTKNPRPHCTVARTRTASVDNWVQVIWTLSTWLESGQYQSLLSIPIVTHIM